MLVFSQYLRYNSKNNLIEERVIEMGRAVTVDIKSRVKVTIYPSQHINLQEKLKRYIDKTIHCDAVLATGMKHVDEVIEEIEKLTRTPKKPTR
jgi:hypothetical protein